MQAAMGFFEIFGYVGILRESLKIVSKNGLIMAIITTISIFLNSLLFISILSTKSVIKDLLAKEKLLLIGLRSPAFSDLLVAVIEDIRIILGIELAVLITSSAVSLFSAGLTILASAAAFPSKRQSFKEILSVFARSCKRLLITSFHISLLKTGYLILVLAILIFVAMFVSPSALKPTSIMVGIVASLLWTYLSVVWVLAVVISVTEESCYGIEALGRAAGIVKGKRLQGFALKSLFAVAFLIIFQGFRMTINQKLIWMKIIMGILLAVLHGVAGIFEFVAYTVFCFQCKKTRGEEIEMKGGAEYSKIPSIPVVMEDAPCPDEC